VEHITHPSSACRLPESGFVEDRCNEGFYTIRSSLKNALVSLFPGRPPDQLCEGYPALAFVFGQPFSGGRNPAEKRLMSIWEEAWRQFSQWQDGVPDLVDHWTAAEEVLRRFSRRAEGACVVVWPASLGKNVCSHAAPLNR
jgi:hypothetical protein